jgi:type III restriction enzyme
LINWDVQVNIFNISKINSEVRGGKAPRIKRLSEYIGESYFDYLAGLPDLMLIMDESHRYRASAGVRAINELKPVLGLELTATPFVETARGPVSFKNVIYDYPLGKAMADGFVKEPAVVTRKNFNPADMSAREIEQLKLEDGVRLHEAVKVELETYARETGRPVVKPFLLVIARDTTHAGQLVQLIQSDAFFEGRYEKKVIQVDSSKTGAEEDEMVQRLLAVESTEEPTEIVVHVNMLKEGWDVTNLYTIVPLRAANARTLIEQSIGRGLRLPYGERTHVSAVDRLNIVAHDRFQEIIDEANRPDSTIRLQQVILDPDELRQKTVTIVSQPQIAHKLGFQPAGGAAPAGASLHQQPAVFEKPEEQRIAQITYEVIRKLQSQPQKVPSIAYLQKPEMLQMLREKVEEQYVSGQMELEGIKETPNIAAVVARTTEMVIQDTINIPRILVVPKGEMSCGFKSFTLELGALNYPAPSDELWIQYLRTNQSEVVGLSGGGFEEARLEDYVVSGLMDFDDIAYDNHADLLYDLAGQVVQHFQGYLSEGDLHKVLRLHQREIARFVHAQMQEHYWEDEVEYEVRISKGYSELKNCAYTALPGLTLDLRQSPVDKSNMAKYVFVGFKRCLYAEQKFQSDSERKLAVVLDRETLKWFKPALGQFQIEYRWNGEHPLYQPDFVAETDEVIYMLEPKARNEMDAPDVTAKKGAAVRWCKQATEYGTTCEGKPWKYLLIPHDAIAENISLDSLAFQYEVK